MYSETKNQHMKTHNKTLVYGEEKLVLVDCENQIIWKS